MTLLIDANNLICSVYYGMKSHGNRVGEEKGREAISQAVRKRVQNLIRAFQPTYVLAGLDSPISLREELYEGYKKRNGKAPKPDELREMLQTAHELLADEGVLPVQAHGYEADDILATLTQRAPGEVIIVSADRDLHSLISSDVHISDPTGRTLTTENDFSESLPGLRPAQLPFFKALTGDQSDNIPGIPGLRHRQALRLVVKYETPEALYDNLHELPPGIRRKLETQSAAELRDKMKLISLEHNVPISVMLMPETT